MSLHRKRLRVFFFSERLSGILVGCLACSGMRHRPLHCEAPTAATCSSGSRGADSSLTIRLQASPEDLNLNASGAKLSLSE